MKATTTREWEMEEAKWGLGYNGQSAWWKQEIAQQLQEKEEQDKVTHKG